MSLEELKKRIDTIEQSYEFMLAYAAQGLKGDEGSKTGGELRRLLGECDDAIEGLADVFRRAVERERLEPKDAFFDFIDVLEKDVRRAQAGLRLTKAQPSISSQMVDNLNGSLQLRTLLMDIFLVDEIVKQRLLDRGTPA